MSHEQRMMVRKERDSKRGLKCQVAALERKVNSLAKKPPPEATNQDKDRDTGDKDQDKNNRQIVPVAGHAFGGRAEMKRLKNG